ncbi:hypothetical protein AB6H26_06305 [Providencia hangzhouensis]|uniref:Uncharacterized protein n=2 Tax=Providencia TaxID=586 RepID=A0A9N8GZG0_PRORE|nr:MULTISPECIES: hypothetical protein [Providencia]MBN7842061.1 hypothetical protein [Providencia rettgeri]MBN7855243.1 hypothetical protein [Providencia rettgeri]MBN7863630.1 hypothetical protein [Providencia rettgeri]MBN7873450.1 hypothetical protein [Providencia rettgeri]MBN7898007.1 hypothetical protein [Providencia rettgeri]
MSTQIMRNSHLTNIPHPIISNLNRLTLDKEVKAELVNQQQKLGRFVDNIKQKKQIDLTGSKIPIRLPTLRHAYSEPSKIHKKNISGALVLNRSNSEPSNLDRVHRTPVKKGVLARTQPNYQINQTPRSLQYIQKAKDDKIAAYQSLSDTTKSFLREKLSYKILVTFKKGLNGKETKQFMVAYEEFRQGVSDKEKEKYQQNKLSGFTPDNRFQFTKTVWIELDKLILIPTKEEITKIVANTKWSHLNR